MITLRGILILSATITGNQIVAYSVRQGLIALGTNEVFAGGVATTVWSVIAFSMLTSIAVRLSRRRTGAGTNGAANGSDARYSTLAK